jgi:diadenosine tetraphosphate (Ap4A) HIT family hydrolase
MDLNQWEALVRGTDCPFDLPRPESNQYWEIVAQLDVSTLYLTTNQAYRGQCLLVLDLRHATRPDQLSTLEWTAFCSDLHRAERAIVRTVNPDHINIAALGNVIPHLHWHIVPRYRNDPRWGAPIWPTNLADMVDTRLPAAEWSRLLAELRDALGA